MNSKKVFHNVLSDDAVRKLASIGIESLSDYINELEAKPESVNLQFKEKIELLIDLLYQNKINSTIRRLRKSAKLREPDACIQDIIYNDKRHLSRTTVLSLATCDYMHYNTNIVIESPTGSGKTYFACALANAAIERCIRTKYVRLPDLLQEYEEYARLNKSKRTLITKYSNPQLLVIDEWLLLQISESFCTFLLEIFERRKDTSTIICTLYPQSDWHERLGGSVQAESIIDRIVHNCVDISLGDLNMRAYTSPIKHNKMK